jgi:hypothetical protein
MGHGAKTGKWSNSWDVAWDNETTASYEAGRTLDMKHKS